MFSAANLPEAEGLSILSFVASQKVLPSREEPDVSLSIVNSKALTCYILTSNVCIVSTKHGSTLIHTAMICM